MPALRSESRQSGRDRSLIAPNQSTALDPKPSVALLRSSDRSTQEALVRDSGRDLHANGQQPFAVRAAMPAQARGSKTVEEDREPAVRTLARQWHPSGRTTGPAHRCRTDRVRLRTPSRSGSRRPELKQGALRHRSAPRIWIANASRCNLPWDCPAGCGVEPMPAARPPGATRSRARVCRSAVGVSGRNEQSPARCCRAW